MKELKSEFDRMFDETSERVNEFQIANEPKQVEHITIEEYKESRKQLRILIESKSELMFDKHGNEIKALPINRVMMFLDEHLELNLKEISK